MAVVIEIYLDDAKMSYDESEVYFHNAHCWAKEHCAGYKGHHVQDVSDVSYVCDNVALYLFEDEKEALIFRLKYEKT